MDPVDQLRYSGAKYHFKFDSIEITGSDAESFLHSQCTQDIKSMNNFSFVFSALLQHQGRVESYFIVLKENKNKYLILLPSDDLNRSKNRFEKFLISEDVNLNETQTAIELNFKALSENNTLSYQGSWANELCEMNLNVSKEITDNKNELQKLEILNGFPEFSLNKYFDQIINNTDILQNAVSFKKGCFPGQETVSKIHNNRGAAYAPMLLESKDVIEINTEIENEINMFDKKVGTIEMGVFFRNSFYYPVRLIRDYRIKNLKIEFNVGDKTYKALVVSHPLLSGEPSDKANELLQMASSLHSQNNSDEALQLIDLALEIDPTSPDLYESKGVILGQMNKYNEAIEEMDHLLKIDPSSVLAHTNKSLFLMKLGKIKEAEDEKGLATVKSFAKFGEDAKNKKILEEKKLKDKQDREKRFSMFQQVLEIDPDDTLANFGLGSFYFEEQKLDLAQNHLEKVLSFDSKYSNAYLFLGKTLMALNEKNKAKEILETGVKVAAARGDLMPANEMNQILRSIN
jgi:folate-binding protein YgfZ